MASTNANVANSRRRSRHGRCPIRPPFPEIMANRGTAELLLDEDDIPKKPMIAPAKPRGKRGVSGVVLPNLSKLDRSSSPRSHLGALRSSNPNNFARDLPGSSKPWNGMKTHVDSHGTRRRGLKDTLHNRSPAVDWSMQVSTSDSVLYESEECVPFIDPGHGRFGLMAALFNTRPVSSKSANHISGFIPSPSQAVEIKDNNEDDFELPYEEMNAFPYLPSMSLVPIEMLPRDTSEEWEKPPYTCEEMRERVKQKRLAERQT